MARGFRSLQNVTGRGLAAPDEDRRFLLDFIICGVQFCHLIVQARCQAHGRWGPTRPTFYEDPKRAKTGVPRVDVEIWKGLAFV